VAAHLGGATAYNGAVDLAIRNAVAGAPLPPPAAVPLVGQQVWSLFAFPNNQVPPGSSPRALIFGDTIIRATAINGVALVKGISPAAAIGSFYVSSGLAVGGSASGQVYTTQVGSLDGSPFLRIPLSRTRPR
jgi:hypothetical protein